MNPSDILIRFLREREHQFRYGFSMVPNVAAWGAPWWNDLKRRFGGRSNAELNCWELVFYAYYRSRLIVAAPLERLARLRNALYVRERDDTRRRKRILDLIRNCLVGPGNEGRALSGHMSGSHITAPVDEAYFRTILPGSTVIFAVNDAPISHVAIKIDHDQMAHIAQSLSGALG